MEKIGLSAPIRKIAQLMDGLLDLEMEALEHGLFISRKTKIKNSEYLISYTDVSHYKGYDDEDVEVTMRFDQNGDIDAIGYITKDGQLQYTGMAKYSIQNGQLVISRTVDQITTKRTFLKKF